MVPKQAPVAETQNHSLRERLFTKTGAVIAAGTLVVGSLVTWGAGAFEGGEKSNAGEVPTGAIATPVSDAELLTGGYNCSSEDRPEESPFHFDYSDQINFLNQKPELVEELEDFIVNDPTYGMGEEAWKGLLKSALTNPDTPEDKKVESSDDMNIYAHKIMRAPVFDETNFINFTCEGNDGNGEFNIHVNGLVTLNSANLVDGFVVNEKGLAKWVNSAENQERYKIQYLGTREVTRNNKITKEDLYQIVVEANGCKNPLRLPEDVPGAPGTTTTTKPGQPKGFPAPTLAPPPTVPGGGGNGGGSGGNPEGGIPGGGDSGEGAPPNDETPPTTNQPPATAPPAPPATGHPRV